MGACVTRVQDYWTNWLAFGPKWLQGSAAVHTSLGMSLSMNPGQVSLASSTANLSGTKLCKCHFCVSFVGDIYANPELLIPQQADKINLQRIYDTVSL